MAIGDRIKMRRNELGLTLYELAEKIGVREATVQRYESGNIKNLKQDTISSISLALNVTPAYLMGWEEKTNDELLNTRDKRDIAKKLEELLNEVANTQDALMFDGEPLDDESRELFKTSLENSLQIAKIMAKKKFTPKKYR